MERKEKPWYRILWTSETTLAFGGAFMWGWVLLLPALAIAVGVVSLFGSVADVKDTDTRIALWGAGALSLFFGYCVGYLSGYGERGKEAKYEGYRTQSGFEEIYRRDISDLQGQVEHEQSELSKRIWELAAQVEGATSECGICGYPSKFIYDAGRWKSVMGICGTCDELIQMSQRMKLVPRRAAYFERKTGISPTDKNLLRLIATELPELGGDKVRRLSHAVVNGLPDEPGEFLTPKSWAEENLD